MKKRIAIVLALILCLSLIPAASAKGTQDNYILATVSPNEHHLKGYGICVPFYIWNTEDNVWCTLSIYKDEVKLENQVHEAFFDINNASRYQEYNYVWNAAKMPAGTYVVRLELNHGYDEEKTLMDQVQYNLYLEDQPIDLEEILVYDYAAKQEVKKICVAEGTEELTEIGLRCLPENTTLWASIVDVETELTSSYLDYQGFDDAMERGVYCRAYPDRIFIHAETRGAYLLDLCPMEEMPRRVVMEVCTDDQGHDYVPVNPETDGSGCCGAMRCTKCGWVTTEKEVTDHAWVPTYINGDSRRYVCLNCFEEKGEEKHICPIPFADHVPENNWAHEGIDYVVREGLMNGTGENKFSPNMSLNRAQLVTILFRLAGAPVVSGDHPFTDLTQGWYKEAVCWAYENGVVKGMTDTTFAPDVPVTREVFATMLYRYYTQYMGASADAGADLSAFPDVSSVHGFAQEAMSWAVAEGIINGTTKGGVVCLDPTGRATRAQAASILMRFVEGIKE